MNTITPLEQEIIKEFEQQFGEFYEYTVDEFGNTEEDYEIIRNFKSFLFQSLAKQREAMRKNHFCCKYQTIKEYDFCDHCLDLLK